MFVEWAGAKLSTHNIKAEDLCTLVLKFSLCLISSSCDWRHLKLQVSGWATKTTASHLLLVPLSPAALVMLGRGSLSSTRGLGRGLSSPKLPPLLLLMAMMAGKASSAGLSLTLGFSPGLPQPQDCPRFLDSLEVQSYFSPIHLLTIILPPHPSFTFYILHGNCFESILRKGFMRKARPSDWWWQNQHFASRSKIVQILEWTR